VVVSNQDGKVMPIFYMLCTKDKDAGHERIAIQLAMTHVFFNLEDVRVMARNTCIICCIFRSIADFFLECFKIS